MKKTASLVALATIFMLVGCGGDEQAPGEKDGDGLAAGGGLVVEGEETETGERGGKFANWREAARNLGEVKECGARNIFDSIETEEAGKLVSVTWWRGNCGEVLCTGMIVAEPETSETRDSGSCTSESRETQFEGPL